MIPIGAIMGGVQMLGGLIGQISQANKKFPEYSASPQLQNSFNRAEQMAKGGYTPAEQAAFKQNLAQQTALQRQNAIDMGGSNLAQAVQGQLGMNQINALNQFASADAGLKRENIRYADSLAKALQDIQNRNTAMQQQIHLQSTQAAANAFKTGTENLVGGLNSLQQFNYLTGAGGGANVGNNMPPEGNMVEKSAQNPGTDLTTNPMSQSQQNMMGMYMPPNGNANQNPYSLYQQPSTTFPSNDPLTMPNYMGLQTF